MQGCLRTCFGLEREWRQKLVFTWWCSATSLVLEAHPMACPGPGLWKPRGQEPDQLSGCLLPAVDPSQEYHSGSFSVSHRIVSFWGSVSFSFASWHVEQGQVRIRQSPPASPPPLPPPLPVSRDRPVASCRLEEESPGCANLQVGRCRRMVDSRMFSPEAAWPLGPTWPTRLWYHPLPGLGHCWPRREDKWGFRSGFLWPH